MPRETKAYLCAFRCGRQPTIRLSAALYHESLCRLNPARRTCCTCVHDRRVEADEGCPQASFWCAIDKKQDRPGDPAFGIPPEPARMVYDCPSWELKARSAPKAAPAVGSPS
jgi:hypothetical protein